MKKLLLLLLLWVTVVTGEVNERALHLDTLITQFYKDIDQPVPDTLQLMLNYNNNGGLVTNKDRYIYVSDNYSSYVQLYKISWGHIMRYLSFILRRDQKKYTDSQYQSIRDRYSQLLVDIFLSDPAYYVGIIKRMEKEFSITTFSKYTFSDSINPIVWKMVIPTNNPKLYSFTTNLFGPHQDFTELSQYSKVLRALAGDTAMQRLVIDSIANLEFCSELYFDALEILKLIGSDDAMRVAVQYFSSSCLPTKICGNGLMIYSMIHL